MTRVLLITGARSLADDPGADAVRAWLAGHESDAADAAPSRARCRDGACAWHGRRGCDCAECAGRGR